MAIVMSWTNFDLVNVKKLADGRGLFSRIFIQEGSMIGIFDGQVEVFTIRHEGLVDWRNHDPSMSIHLALENDRLYALMPLKGQSVDGIDFINHSCTPNCMVSTQGLVVRANQNIECGEHLTIDYRPMDLIKLGRPCWCSHVPDAQRCIL